MLVPYCALLRIHSLLHPQTYAVTVEDGWLNHVIYTSINDNPLIASIVAIIVISAQAFFLSYISNVNRLIGFNNYMVGMLYILLTSYLSTYQVLSPVMLGQSFFMLALYSLYNSYLRPSAAGSLFNVAFFIMMASMFYFPFILFLIFGLIGLSFLRNLSGREYLQYVSGAIVAAFFAFTVLFFNDGFETYFLDYIRANVSYDHLAFKFTSGSVFVVGVNAAFIILSLLSYYAYLKKKPTHVQRKIELLYWIPLIALVSIFFWRQAGYDHFIILAVALSIMLAMNVVQSKNQVLLETLHIGMLVLLITHQFGLWTANI